MVRLDGSDSRDNNNRALSYNWTVVRGPLNLTLDNPTSVRPILNVPSIEEDVYAIIKLRINNGVSTAKTLSRFLLDTSTATTSYIPTRPEIRFVVDTDSHSQADSSGKCLKTRILRVIWSIMGLVILTKLTVKHGT